VLPFGWLWYDTPENAIGYPMHTSRSHDAVIRVYDEASNVEWHLYEVPDEDCKIVPLTVNFFLTPFGNNLINIAPKVGSPFLR
jgi:hypothetical protein